MKKITKRNVDTGNGKEYEKEYGQKGNIDG